MAFREEQIARYSRHIILKEVGGRGQEKLLAARVLIIGAGGLGSPVAMYLAAAGIGTIGLIDMDVVDVSNLQRQIMHSQKTVGIPKVLSGERSFRFRNALRLTMRWISFRIMTLSLIVLIISEPGIS
jgi:adenylyltransferase/sulfurtransferase